MPGNFDSVSLIEKFLLVCFVCVFECLFNKFVLMPKICIYIRDCKINTIDFAEDPVNQT